MGSSSGELISGCCGSGFTEEDTAAVAVAVAIFNLPLLLLFLGGILRSTRAYTQGGAHRHSLDARRRQRNHS